MSEAELIDRYIDALKRDPKALPPLDLDANTADFVRALVLSQQAKTPSSHLQDRVWHKALTQAELGSGNFSTPKTSSNGTSQNVIRLKSKERVQMEDEMSLKDTLIPTNRTIPGTHPPEARYLLQYTATIAAVLLVFVLVGGVLIQMINGLGRGGYPASALTITETATPQIITAENINQLQLLKILGRGTINDIAWSPDGKKLALANNNGRIWLFDPDALDHEPDSIEVHGLDIQSVAFSPDSQHIASVGLFGNSGIHVMRLWNLVTGESAPEIKEDNALQSIVFSPDGSLLAEALSNAIILRNVATGEQIALLEGHEKQVNSLAFSPDGKTLVSGADDNTVRLWGVPDGNLLATLQGHEGSVTSVAFSPDGAMVASGSADDTIRLWRWDGTSTGGEPIIFSGHTDDILKIAFSPTGKLLASASKDKTIRLWDIQNGTPALVLNGHTDQVRSIAFSPDGNRLASISPDETLRLWDIANHTEVKQVAIPAGHTGSVTAVFSPDGQTLAAPGNDGNIHLWDIATGDLKSVLRANHQGIFGVAYSPDGNALVSGGNDKGVRIWNLATGENQAFKKEVSALTSVAYSPDGKTVASSGTLPELHIWDVATGESRLLKGHQHQIWSVAYSPDGETLASAGTDGTIRLWDVVSGEPKSVLQGSSSGMGFVVFSPDGRLLAATSFDVKNFVTADNVIWLWDLTHPDKEPILLQSRKGSTMVGFSPDSKLLASVNSASGQIDDQDALQFWDPATGTPLYSLPTGHSVSTVSFNPDGKTMAVALNDGTIQIWGLP